MAKLTGKQVIAGAWLLTIGIEAITAFMRFGLKIQSTRDTASILSALTGGIRIHHGYIGLLLAVAALLAWRRWPPVARWMLLVGVALVASDLIHHFVVLRLVVGDPQFDLVYPK